MKTQSSNHTENICNWNMVWNMACWYEAVRLTASYQYAFYTSIIAQYWGRKKLNKQTKNSQLKSDKEAASMLAALSWNLGKYKIFDPAQDVKGKITFDVCQKVAVCHKESKE